MEKEISRKQKAQVEQEKQYNNIKVKTENLKNEYQDIDQTLRNALS
jgi:hypothetical protein